MLVAHLSLSTVVKAGNEKEQPDDEDLATQCTCKIVHEEKREQYLHRKVLQDASDDKDKRQETHEDICQIALLPTDQAAIGRGSRESDDPPITMHVRQRHGLDVYRLSATWAFNGAIATELRMQIKSARFTEEQLFSSLLTRPPPACSFSPLHAERDAPPRHARILRPAPSAPPDCSFMMGRGSRCASL